MSDKRIEVVVRVRPSLPKETSPLRNKFTAIPLKKRSDEEETDGFAGFDDVLLEGAEQPEVGIAVETLVCVLKSLSGAFVGQLECVIQKLRPSGFGRVPTCVSAVLNIGHWGGTIIRAFYGAQTLIENLTPLNPSTRPQVYTRLGQGLLERLMQGYNISVLAYGQTGAGKTHTMTGPPGSAANGSARGLIPRLMEDLLRRKQNLELQGKRSSTFINLQIPYVEHLPGGMYMTQQAFLLEPYLRRRDGGGARAIR
eukprot:421604-Pyramimonas_sp.AAC.1